MLALSTLLLFVAAVAFVSLRGNALGRVLGTLAALLGVWGSVRAWGWVEGMFVTLTLAMACASSLSLILPPRRHLTWRVGLASSGLGLGLFILQALQ